MFVIGCLNGSQNFTLYRVLINSVNLADESVPVGIRYEFTNVITNNDWLWLIWEPVFFKYVRGHPCHLIADNSRNYQPKRNNWHSELYYLTLK